MGRGGGGGGSERECATSTHMLRRYKRNCTSLQRPRTFQVARTTPKSTYATTDGMKICALENVKRLKAEISTAFPSALAAGVVSANAVPARRTAEGERHNNQVNKNSTDKTHTVGIPGGHGDHAQGDQSEAQYLPTD